jgi:hypothetical protein
MKSLLVVISFVVALSCLSPSVAQSQGAQAPG